jgi:Cdc6-like AAA superfamily ATPase
MPYEKTPSRLEALIAKALSEEEIRSGASQADLEIDVLRKKVLEPGLEKKAPTIWEAGASKIEDYNKLENEYQAYLTRLRREEEQLRRSYLRIPRGVMVAILAALGLAFVALCLVALVIGLSVLGLISSGLLSIGNSTILGLLTVIATLTLTLTYIPISRSLYRRYLAAKKRYNNRLAEIQRERASNSLGEQLRTVEQEVERAVIEGGILQELRDIIGAYSPSYKTTLAITSAPGLAEVFNPAYEIPTEPKEKLHRLLANMPGGSIGISGPRGVGKTTLLGSFCSKTSTTEIEDRPVLSVMISAPVKYNPREFILHIFSSVCQRVLEIKDKKDPQSPWEHIDGMRRSPITFFSTVLDLREALAVVALGLILMSTLLVPDLLSNLSAFFFDYFFGLGLFLVFLGVVGLLFRTFQMLQERRQSQREKEKEKELYGDDLLVSKAFKWLGDIQFQQSYSSGWAGSLKANITPVGVETTVDAAVELAKNQMSLPEIVDRYQEFLKLASKEYVIIIGIDEMDKMGSDEEAMNFLNEIKALFGLESCFYLISVSESAMSSFERRGLHFRDVFDSSFDAIIYADYLNLDRAHRLLRRRVVGVPVPFLDLCHCMVGGLPRDLIRVFRALYEEHMLSDSDDNDLSTLCGALIRADLKAKLRATSIAAKKDGTSEAEVNDLLERLRKLEALLDTADPLLTICPGLLDGYTTLLASRVV